MNKRFLKDLLDIAVIYDTFGGKIDRQKQKGFDKFIKMLKHIACSNG